MHQTNQTESTGRELAVSQPASGALECEVLPPAEPAIPEQRVPEPFTLEAIEAALDRLEPAFQIRDEELRYDELLIGIYNLKVTELFSAKGGRNDLQSAADGDESKAGLDAWITRRYRLEGIEDFKERKRALETIRKRFIRRRNAAANLNFNAWSTLEDWELRKAAKVLEGKQWTLLCKAPKAQAALADRQPPEPCPLDYHAYVDVTVALNQSMLLKDQTRPNIYEDTLNFVWGWLQLYVGARLVFESNAEPRNSQRKHSLKGSKK